MQPKKALSPMVRSPSGKVIDVRLSQFMKASSAICAM